MLFHDTFYVLYILLVLALILLDSSSFFQFVLRIYQNVFQLVETPCSLSVEGEGERSRDSPLLLKVKKVHWLPAFKASPVLLLLLMNASGECWALVLVV